MKMTHAAPSRACALPLRGPFVPCGDYRTKRNPRAVKRLYREDLPVIPQAVGGPRAGVCLSPGGGGGLGEGGPAPPPCDIPSGCCSFTGPWTVTRSSLRMLRRVAAFCRPLRPVLLLVSFPRSRSPVVGVLGLCWMWRDVPFARQWRPIICVLRMCWLLLGSFDCFCPPLGMYPGRTKQQNCWMTQSADGCGYGYQQQEYHWVGID